LEREGTKYWHLGPVALLEILTEELNGNVWLYVNVSWQFGNMTILRKPIAFGKENDFWRW
jgi:hypothetical protein